MILGLTRFSLSSHLVHTPPEETTTGHEQQDMRSVLGTLEGRDAGFKETADRELIEGAGMQGASQEEDSDDDVIEIGFTVKGKRKAKLSNWSRKL